MEKSKLKYLLPCIGATGGLLALSGALFLMNRQVPYHLFCLTAIFLLLLGALNLCLLLFRFSPALQQIKAAESVAVIGSAEAAGDTPTAEAETVVAAEAEEYPAAQTGRCKKARRSAKPLPASVRAIGHNLLVGLYRAVRMLLLFSVVIGGAVWFGIQAAKPLGAEAPVYWQLALLVIFFVVTIVMDKLCKYVTTEDHFAAMLLRNARAFFTLARIMLVLLALCLTLQLLNLADIRAKIVTVLVILFYYTVCMLAFSLAVRIFRKELPTAPGMVILLPFFNADIQELAIIPFLEQNTGITLRNLWSIRYLSNTLPYTIVAAAALFWMATGLVYVQSHQEAAVYRLGVLRDETLKPGLHMTLPRPLDNVVLYDTDRMNTLTIGYISAEHSDNIWTAANGQEYKLLLGSGNELVSINLRVEYRISDLNRYLSTSASPEQILEASAYKLVADRTMSTDLATLLSTDRETFTQAFLADLSAELETLNTGLELVGVIMESIHPPIEVSITYQQFLGAEIDAEKIILNAQAESAVKMAEAEQYYQETLNIARSDYWDKLAKAKTEVAEFVAAVETSETYADEYAYYKYLDALTSAYQGSKLVIVGSGVDRSRLYFGNFGAVGNAVAAASE